MIPPPSSMGLSAAGNNSSSNFPNFPGLPALMASLGDKSQTSNYQPQHHVQLTQLVDDRYAQPSHISDLERLERLKKEILDGQNPFYTAVPRPDYLKSLYLGRLPQEKSPSPVQRAEATQAVPSGEASGISGEVHVKQEDIENPLAGIQMSDILALSSKLLSRNSFTFSCGPNGVEARKKSETEANGLFSNAAHTSQSHSRETSQMPPVAHDVSQNGSMASSDTLEQRMRSPSETLGVSDPPYDPKEGLASSNLYARLPGNSDPAEVQIGYTSAPGQNIYPTDHYTHYRNEPESPNGYPSHGPSLPYDTTNSGSSRDLMERGDCPPLEERDSTSDHFVRGPEHPIGSLQDRIGQRVPHSATPVLSPTSSSGYRPLNHYNEPSRDQSAHRSPPFDASEEVIRQAILEREAASDDRARPALEDRIDRERASYPPKFAAKRGHGYGSPHLPPPPPESDRERTRRWSNASRPTGDSPIRRDSHGPATSKPLSWDREAPADPPSVYPPPPPSDYDSRPPFGAFRDYPRSRPVGRTPTPPPQHRRPSGEFGTPRTGMKRGREDDFNDTYDRRYSGFGRAPTGLAGYYDDRGPYPYDYDRRPGDVVPPRGMYRPDPSYLPPPRTA